MHAQIAGELGMKRSEQHRALASEHRNVVVGRQHLDAGSDAFDHRRPDEHPGERAAVQRERYGALIVGIVAYSTLRLEWPAIGDDPTSLPLAGAIGWCNISALNVLAWVLAATGFLTRWLNRSAPALAYLSEATLPVYMLHQTLIVFAVFHLHHVAWPLGEKMALTFAFALTGSFALYELAIRRSHWLRLLFGVKDRAAGIGLEALMPGASDVRSTSRWRGPSS